MNDNKIITESVIAVLNKLAGLDIKSEYYEVVKDFYDESDSNLSNRDDRFEFCLKPKCSNICLPIFDDTVMKLNNNVNTRLFFKDDFDIDYNIDGDEEKWGFFFNMTDAFKMMIMKKLIEE